jgi:hypothetical protein
LAKFASQTLSSVLDRYVVDMANVPGCLIIHLEFGPDESIRADVFGGGRVSRQSEKGSEHLHGLGAATWPEEDQRPSRILFIDHVERPSGIDVRRELPSAKKVPASAATRLPESLSH